MYVLGEVPRGDVMTVTDNVPVERRLRDQAGHFRRAGAENNAALLEEGADKIEELRARVRELLETRHEAMEEVRSIRAERAWVSPQQRRFRPRRWWRR